VNNRKLFFLKLDGHQLLRFSFLRCNLHGKENALRKVSSETPAGLVCSCSLVHTTDRNILVFCLLWALDLWKLEGVGYFIHAMDAFMEKYFSRSHFT